ncbi:unnamed protein product [Thelazia callipaeda]|uniref:protein-histidine N-methyltransferase n=1 Tax=Thelazia callipaeda TaxID=103827 RepID=A0A0N5D0W7_THECL|nr:unnamed protein product [Thelazia callipaeda]
MGSKHELHSKKSYKPFSNHSFLKFLDKLKNQVNEIWKTVFCHLPSSNVNELFKEHLIIRDFLLQIERMQNTLSRKTGSDLPYVEQRNAALSEFLEWASKVGIVHHLVKITYVEEIDGFGLSSSDFVTIGSELLKVPRKAILSWDQARKSYFLKSNLIFQYLRPSPLFEEALLLYRNIARQFTHFLLEIIYSDEFRHERKKSREESKMEPIFADSPLTAVNFKFDLYRWSVACISTRINMIPSAVYKSDMGQPRMVCLYKNFTLFPVPALIPFLDMANHSYTDEDFYEAVHFSDETDCAVIIALRNYEPSELVNIFYGWRNNRDFLLHNGFVPMENIRDTYKLKIGLPKSKRESERMDLFHSLGFVLDSTIFTFEVKAFEPYFHRSLFEFVQIYVLDEIPSNSEEIKKFLNSSNNIRKAWNFLHDRFSLLCASYGEVSSLVCTVHQNSSECSKSIDCSRKSMIATLKSSEIKILRKAEIFCGEQLLKMT